MKKLCFITSRFHPMIGGTELLAKSILEFVGENSKDTQVTIVTQPCEERKTYKHTIKEISFGEEEVFNSFIKNEGFDLCVFICDLHTPYLNYYKFGCDKNLCILNLDETTYDNIDSWNLRGGIEVLKKFDMCTTFTKQGIANKFLEENEIKNIYIPNFSRDVLATKNDKDFKKLIFNNEKTTILYNGAFEVRKNQHNILLRISESQTLRQLNWIFIGAHPSREYLKYCDDFVKRENLVNNVKFLKPTTNTETLDKLYQSVDMLMLTSIAEGLPLVLLEAISAGLPWVATPVGGIRGVLEETNTGVILDKINFDVKDIENSIGKVLENKLGNSRKIWETNFNKQNVCQMHLSNIENLL